ncbi:MAG: response regulator [Candidatus Dormibacteria bacterium]
MKKTMRVLLVDDDSPNLELYRLAFTMRGHAVLTAHSGEQAIELFTSEHPDAVICDLILGDMVGTEAIERMRALGEARFYLLSEAEPIVLSTAAERSGVTGFQKLGVPVSDVVRVVSEEFAAAIA